MRKRILTGIVLAFTLIFMSGCSLSLFPNNNTTTYSGTTYTEPTTIEQSQSLEERVIQIADDYISASVTVFVVESSTGTQQSFGSGIGIYEGGYIATNYHVISTVVETSGYELAVYYDKDPVSYSAEILYSNSSLDVAIIKSENSNLPFVEMKDRFIAPTVGEELNALETVIAIGTPIDFTLQNTATLGYVSSASGRLSYADENVYEDLIQHTAPINHGNSGGGLFDSYGYLIGLNTLGNEDANSLFFSVPIYPLTLIIDDVVAAYDASQNFEIGKLGINALDRYQAEYSETSFSETGMLITSVLSGASTGKLYANDIIKGITFEGVTYQVDDRNDLMYTLLMTRPGDVVNVQFERGMFSLDVDITLG